jgi:hypothetical protein
MQQIGGALFALLIIFAGEQQACPLPDTPQLSTSSYCLACLQLDRAAQHHADSSAFARTNVACTT